MAGYTRQSLPDIQNGSEITAPPLNAEFNQLSSAFNGSTGHTHDGSAGNAPKIELSTSVAGYLLPINGGTGGKSNVTATSNPTITDDVNAGYAPGSIWLNTTTNRIFVCVNNTSNAALWYEAVGQTAVSITPETTNTVDIGSTTNRYKDLYLSGSISGTSNATFGGTLNVTGTTTLTDVNATGNATVGGTLGVTGASSIGNNLDVTGDLDVGGSVTVDTNATVVGLATLGQVDANGGTIDNTVIGGNTASPITGTTITSTNGFTGDITGDVTGNVTAATGTSSFANISASGTITGAVSGNVSGNVTSTGTSTFNNVTISGTLNMDGATTATIQNLTDPTNPQDAATKNYVDVGLANLVDTAPAALDTLNELAAAINDDANFSTTMTNALAGKVADTGDTMTGNLIMSGATVTGLPLPTANSEAASKQYTDQQDALQVSRSGDSMSGNLAMGSNNITGLAAPTANDHATSKQYVDGILGSATAASASAAAAATSEANASVSAANAATSETNAANSATAAAASYDDFDDRYLGAKSSAPSVDNDGDALVTGALYWDTTSNELYVWSGTAWDQGTFTTGSFLANLVEDTTPQLGGDLDTNGKHIKFPDGSITAAPNTNILSFGNSDDMKLWHQGGVNYIQGSQAISIQASDIYLRKGNYSTYETMASFVGDGAVNLFYNNVYKFGTTSTGIDVSGDVTASDDLFVNGGFARISDATTPTLELRNTDTTVANGQELGVIDFYGSDGTWPYAGVKASIKAVATGHWNLGDGNGSELQFAVTNSYGNVNEVLRASLNDYHLVLRTYQGLRMYDSDESNYVSIQPASATTQNYTIKLPPAAPSAADQILVSDASGNLSFEAKPTGANIATTMAFA